MRGAAAITAIVISLSTITWVLIYYLFPDAPLKRGETALVVFVYVLLTIGLRAVFRRFKASKDKT